MKKIEQTLDSREVADMVGKNHDDLMRDIRRYCEQLNESNIALVDFFKQSDYKDGKGQKRPCYNVTKKGCEFIAHKLTGIKGGVLRIEIDRLFLICSGKSSWYRAEKSAEI